jgi:hypothetical protein
MNAHLNLCTSVVQSLVTATIILVGMNSAQAQNPAELVPPAPSSYAGANTLNTLDYINSVQPQNSQPFSAPNVDPNTAPGPTAVAYRVIIPSDNSTLLGQAKAIEPTAFIQLIDGQRVIQVGLFSAEALALQQVARFQAAGMPVRMQQGNSSNIPVETPQTSLSSTVIPTTAMPPEQPSALIPPAPYSPPVGNPSIDSTATNSPFNSSSNKGFYVIIPTVAADVNYVQSQLNQVGIPPQYILVRDRPFGLHYAIGTFSKRSEAERLSDIIRDRTKFDARVYYER